MNTAYGTVKPTAKTVGLGERKGSYNFYEKGYHSYRLATPVKVTANSYFSVGIKVTQGQVAVETRSKGYSDYARILDGESYFSDNGTEWTAAQR